MYSTSAVKEVTKTYKCIYSVGKKRFLNSLFAVQYCQSIYDQFMLSLRIIPSNKKFLQISYAIAQFRYVLLPETGSEFERENEA